MHKIFKLIIMPFFIVIFALLTIFYAVNRYSASKSNNNLDNNKNYLIYKKLNNFSEKDIERMFEIDNRYTLCNKSDESIIVKVGNNKKELENDFYDIKVEIFSKDVTKITIYINKLWKDLFEDGKIYNENYVVQIVDCIISFLDLGEFCTDEICKFILQEYKKIKNIDNVDNVNNLIENFDNNIIRLQNISKGKILILELDLK